MSSLATNADNDIYMNAKGVLVVVRGIDAVKEDCEHVMKAQLGEMVLNLDRGVPTRETVWESWKPVQFEAYARQMLSTIAGVRSVAAFTMQRVGDTATYEAVIQTIYGQEPLTISGEMSA